MRKELRAAVATVALLAGACSTVGDQLTHDTIDTAPLNAQEYSSFPAEAVPAIFSYYQVGRNSRLQLVTSPVIVANNRMFGPTTENTNVSREAVAHNPNHYTNPRKIDIHTETGDKTLIEFPFTKFGGIFGRENVISCSWPYDDRISAWVLKTPDAKVALGIKFADRDEEYFYKQISSSQDYRYSRYCFFDVKAPDEGTNNALVSLTLAQKRLDGMYYLDPAMTFRSARLILPQHP